MPEPTAGGLLKAGREAREEEAYFFRYNLKTKQIEYFSMASNTWQPYQGTARVVRLQLGPSPMVAWVRDEDGNEAKIPTNLVPDAEVWEPEPVSQPTAKPGKGYATKDEAKASALPGEVQIELPDRSWDNVKGPAERFGPSFKAEKGYHWQLLGADENDPKSWEMVEDGFRLVPKLGPVDTDPDTGDLLEPQWEWALVAEARTDVARQPEEAPRQGYEWVWDGNQWVETPIKTKEPSGWFATSEEAAAHAARIGRPDLVPQYNAQSGGFFLGEKAKEPEKGVIVRGEDPGVGGPPGSYFIRHPDGSLSPYRPEKEPKVTAKDLLDKAIMDGDTAAIIRLNDWMNMPTAQERFNMALQYAQSPADYQTVLGMMRGELPPQAGGGAFPRAYDTMQQALFGGRGAGAGAGAGVYAAPVTGYRPGGAPTPFASGTQLPPGYTARPPQIGAPGGAPEVTVAPEDEWDPGSSRGLFPPTVEPPAVPSGQGATVGTTALPSGYVYLIRLGTNEEYTVTAEDWADPEVRRLMERAGWVQNPQGQNKPPWTVAGPGPGVDVMGLTKRAPDAELQAAELQAAELRARLSKKISLVPPEARGGARQARQLLPSLNPDVYRFPSMQQWQNWAVPEQEAFKGGLAERGISGPWWEEYRRQWLASTVPAGARRGRISSARTLIPGGAIR